MSTKRLTQTLCLSILLYSTTICAACHASSPQANQWVPMQTPARTPLGHRDPNANAARMNINSLLSPEGSGLVIEPNKGNINNNRKRAFSPDENEVSYGQAKQELRSSPIRPRPLVLDSRHGLTASITTLPPLDQILSPFTHSGRNTPVYPEPLRSRPLPLQHHHLPPFPVQKTSDATELDSYNYERFMEARSGDISNRTFAAPHHEYYNEPIAHDTAPNDYRPQFAASTSGSTISNFSIDNSNTSSHSNKRQRFSSASIDSRRTSAGEPSNLNPITTQQMPHFEAPRRSLGSNPSPTRSTPSPAPAHRGPPPDVSVIDSSYLPGLLDDSVPVYDSCDEIRRKIREHLMNRDVTQASFLRTLAAQFRPEANRKFQSKQLNTFREYQGADKGNMSAVFYASYVYFERLRLVRAEGKSEHRLGMEEAWPSGFETRTPGPSQRGLQSGPGDAWRVDEFGRYLFEDGKTQTWESGSAAMHYAHVLRNQEKAARMQAFAGVGTISSHVDMLQAEDKVVRTLSPADSAVGWDA